MRHSGRHTAAISRGPSCCTQTGGGIVDRRLPERSAPKCCVLKALACSI